MDTFALITASDAETVDFDWGRLHWYASGPTDTSAAQTVGRCILAPGKQNPKHYHPNCEEVLHVLTGHIEHYVDGQGWLEMNEGDTITIAPNVWHHARNIGDIDAHLLICFSSKDRQTIGEND